MKTLSLSLFFRVFVMLSILHSCKKNNDSTENSSWNTKYIQFENVTGCGRNHSCGYNLYYMGRLIKSSCSDRTCCDFLSRPLVINESVMHIFMSCSYFGSVISTSDGGKNWEYYSVKSCNFVKYQAVNEKLTYCITHLANKFHITGIGKSDLSYHEEIATRGTHYIQDTITDVSGIDSVFIEVNDSMDFVVLLN